MTSVTCFFTLFVHTRDRRGFFIPSKTVVIGGEENIINTAVREALLANGNADVLVGLEKQLKYNDKGEIESITVSGYPAKYVNFRSLQSSTILREQPVHRRA